MNSLSFLTGSIVAVAVLSAMPQETKIPPEAPKASLARVDAFDYDGSLISTVSVKDMKAAKTWYGKVLGAQLFYELEPQGWCEMTTSVPNALIGLNAYPTAKPTKGSTLSFGVKDMAKAKAWLEKNEVRLEGDVVTIPKTVKLLYFFDPDGNKLMFYEPYMGE